MDIKGKSGVIYTCYSSTQELDEVIVTGKSKRGSASSTESSSEETSFPSLWPAGEYVINWDGFDAKGIYDSTLFNGEDLEAVITARKDGKQKNATVDFSTNYSEVQWTDIRIDGNAKRIDVTLRVNLTDGGEEGLSCYEKDYDPDPKIRQMGTVCTWDKIPADVLSKIGKPIIKQRTQSFNDLQRLALKGVEEHWSRNHQRIIGNGISIISDKYEVFVKALNCTKNAMDDVDLKFSSNLYWGRSNNPGDGSTTKSVIANILEYVRYIPLNETIYYNTGYQDYNLTYETELLRKNADWRYIDESIFYYGNNQNTPIEEKEFSYTSAHELGHSILKAFAEKGDGSTDFSYKHKGSSNYSDKLPVTKEVQFIQILGEKLI
ncbi:hypothetical protein HNQ02_003705 [Flavobacterium sp. 7E]|uniref:hypothetical protein n=1 Tax=Flavobacterium sp. 7E TaxID=2735898 RepID=UPI00157003F2|nr:hypothetical protein [Flavobacterium sp. 7E]NRS90758.1 hypothetical protein [Flavobacterium sp. 7E]